MQLTVAQNPLVSFYRSSIGKKWVVASTALILILYVLGHLLGNLQLFIGPDRINAYAEFLHDLGPLLLAIRLFLVLTLVLHIVATIQLARDNRRAKPAKYAVRAYQTSTLAARTMLISGLIVLCFVIYHLLHFTLEVTNPEYQRLIDPKGRHDVYRMLILGFRNPAIDFFYVLGLFLLCLHLSHGFSSAAQTLGINNRKLTGLFSLGGQTLTWLIFAGYVSIPVAIILGLVR
jgi:succinate dehydrogenase / fumarate reductase, cytochrome b subunit